MKVINMLDSVAWVECPGGWYRPSAYRAEGSSIVDTRCDRAVGSLNVFLRQRPDTIVAVTREVAATIDPDLLEQVRVPGVAAMIGGGFYAEPFNPHAANR